ncbi:MAG: nucleotidyl transferase AbiEii/AbiGii toxin family protein [Melioribacteraceae bacterium]|nr:nucleotidyl transferase AbiEii/AbiGii toxin family protein [Saprospiraceae bacterium]MCF8356925.1 nucleotidyl transferase AbiEii/AbiGii toxin family protein [Melioribacteraceae bacterium]MCF8396322.1 nucleotidyl transferase AbiEii/AbiGii toxin family protein [Melioribacteraceae bacterium]
MFKEKCFTEEWLQSFKKQAQHRRIDVNILEKMIYALHLLEQLQQNGLKFTLKGGTSLVLLLDEGNRFSIDIDIISDTKRDELEAILKKVIDSSRFTGFELQDHRSFKPGVPKAHYSFAYESSLKGVFSGTVLLDVLIEDSAYPETTEKVIKAKWVETEDETNVIVPTIDAIIGDKLTAFAPNTIGIPYEKGGQSASMEICKQLYDLSKLFEQILNIETVAGSFQVFAAQEIEYRKEKHPDLTHERVLQDTIDTCLIITKRERGNTEEKAKFAQIQKGIRAFGTGYLMSGNFRIDDAVPASARIAYLATKLLVNDLTPITYYQGQNMKDWNIEDPDWNFLNRLKRQPDKSSFYYWYKTHKLILDYNG